MLTLVLLGLTCLAVPLAAVAQQPGKIYRIAYITVPSRETAQAVASSFDRALRDLGWIPDRNVVVDYRFANGRVDRLPEIVADLVRLKTDVIVAGANAAILAAKKASSTTPIVMFLGIDPVGSGLVTSLAHPTGNVTGLTVTAGYEIYGKQLQILKSAFPRVSRVAMLANRAGSPSYLRALEESQRAARALGLQAQPIAVSDPAEYEGAFASLTASRPDALFVMQDSMFYQHRVLLAQLAAKSRLPAMWGLSDHAEAGGLMAYSTDLHDVVRRAAVYVDKILKGARPADLPIEQPTKFDLVINLKTAKAMGLVIPPALLLQADRVIE